MSDGTATRPTKTRGSSLVFLGSFNPAIFQPAWFMRYELIPDVQDAAKIEAVTSQVTSFTAEWLRVIVQPERCEFHGDDEMPSEKALLDLALGVFNLLRHTPITALGINRHEHFGMESEEAYTELGFRLFDRAPWQSVMNDPKMRSVQIEDRVAGSKSALAVTVQPSHVFEQSVFVAINDHRSVDESAQDSTAATQLLEREFDASLARSAEIIEKVRAL